MTDNSLSAIHVDGENQLAFLRHTEWAIVNKTWNEFLTAPCLTNT